MDCFRFRAQIHWTFDLPNLIRATQATDTLPFVRLPSIDSKLACKLLDFGIYGLIIPNVVSFEHLHQFIQEVTWPPVGRRGVSFNRANGFGEQFSEYSSYASSPFIVPMFEDHVCLEELKNNFSSHRCCSDRSL